MFEQCWNRQECRRSDDYEASVGPSNHHRLQVLKEGGSRSGEGSEEEETDAHAEQPEDAHE